MSLWRHRLVGKSNCRHWGSVIVAHQGPYYKHQRWEDGRNVSRRVPTGEVEQLRKAVDGYHEFEELTKEYTEITIGMTRLASKKGAKKKPRS